MSGRSIHSGTNAHMYYVCYLLECNRETYALPFAELFERWSDYTAALHHTVSAHPDISQVPSDDAVIHYYSLDIQTHTIKHLSQPNKVHE